MNSNQILTPEQAKSALNHKKFIALDTESTGFHPNDTYSFLIEIGAVKVINGEVVDRFDELINPGIPIPKRIEELTGITDAMVANKENYIEVLSRFRKWCDSDEFIFIMHNAPHDLKFLNYFGKKCGIEFNEPTIDTQPVAKSLLHDGYWETISKRINENYKLSSLATLFGIPDKNHHRADNDAELTYEVFSKLRKVAFKKEPNLVYFQTFKYPSKNKEINSKTKEKQTAKIVSICPWDKKERIYIKLSKEQENETVYGTIFYDFSYKNWRIKETGFPIKTFAYIEKRIKELYGTEDLTYENFQSRMYPSCFVNIE